MATKKSWNFICRITWRNIRMPVIKDSNSKIPKAIKRLLMLLCNARGEGHDFTVSLS